MATIRDVAQLSLIHISHDSLGVSAGIPAFPEYGTSGKEGFEYIGDRGDDRVLYSQLLYYGF